MTLKSEGIAVISECTVPIYNNTENSLYVQKRLATSFTLIKSIIPVYKAPISNGANGAIKHQVATSSEKRKLIVSRFKVILLLGQ